MNNFFSKYIPVEGEIKEGDSWMAANGDVVEGNTTGRMLYHANKSRQKKVKLFLCSMDIRKGDKVWHTIDGVFYDIIGIFEDISIVTIKGNKLIKECVKVIGEISPESYWVKEGDEFETKEVVKLIESYA